MGVASILFSALSVRPLVLSLHPRGQRASPASSLASALSRLSRLSGSPRLPALPVVLRIIFLSVMIPPWGLRPRVTLICQ